MSKRQNIIILGGDISGAMAAAYLARMLPKARYEISYLAPKHLVMPELFASTSPAIRDLNKLLKISEAQFIHHVHGTFKLGQEFKGWGDASYVRPYAEYGLLIDGNAFHQICCRDGSSGTLKALEDYCLPVAAGRAGKFMPPADSSKPILSDFSYGYHIDATRYAEILVHTARKFGANIIDTEIDATHLSDQGLLSVELANGQTLKADLFINATSSLLEGSAFESWNSSLPCDHIKTERKANLDNLDSFTVNAASADHWTQTSQLQDMDIVTQFYTAGTSAMPETALPFAQGRAEIFWTGNVLNLGLAAAKFVPLDGNGLHMIQLDLERLAELCPPDMSAPMEKTEYNRRTAQTYDRLRDFLAISYKTCRVKGSFGELARSVALPDTAQYKLDLFRARGRIAVYDEESFLRDSWVPMLLGQDIWPERYDRLADQVSKATIAEHKLKLKTFISEIVKQMPSHSDFIAKSCAIPGFNRNSKIS